MNWTISQTVDLSRGYAPVVWPNALMVSGDVGAHTWRLTVLDNGVPADLSGATITGSFLRADGNTVLVSGSVSGNVAIVTLTDVCYAVEGKMKGTIKMTKSGAVITLAAVIFTVSLFASGSIIDPGVAYADFQIDASPAGTYANLAALISADPDHSKIYITLDDGKWCYHNGTTFVAGGVYQADPGEVSTEQMNTAIDAAIAPVSSQLAEKANFTRVDPKNLYNTANQVLGTNATDAIDDAMIISDGSVTVNADTYRAYFVTAPIALSEGQYTLSAKPWGDAGLTSLNKGRCYSSLTTFDSTTVLPEIAWTENANGTVTFTAPAGTKCIRFTAFCRAWGSDDTGATAIAAMNAALMLVSGGQSNVPASYEPYFNPYKKLDGVYPMDGSVTRESLSAECRSELSELADVMSDVLKFEVFVEDVVPSVNLYAPQTEGWMDNATIVTSGYPEVHLQKRKSYCVSPAIPVEGGKTYTVSPALIPLGGLEAKNRIGVYDASGTTLGVLTITDNADGSMTFTVPAAAKTIMLTMRKDFLTSGTDASAAIAKFNATVMLVEGTTAPDEYVPYVPDGNRLKNIALPVKSVKLDTIGDDAKPVVAHLMGKKIANFGDSVFGNARPPLDVSTFLAGNTGATVYNCAFGGCRMAVHSGHWDAFSMYQLAYSIANNDYAVQDEAINYDDRTSYAEEPLAVMKTIDYSALDILTIGYGTNDFTGDNQIDNADNPLDTSTVCGALRYSIETLLTAYPNLRIFVLLPTYRFWMDSDNEYTDDAFNYTNNLGKTLVEYNEAIAETAKAYNIPVIDNFAELGINKVNRYQYFPETDGTHHNENGRKLLAKHIAAKLW